MDNEFEGLTAEDITFVTAGDDATTTEETTTETEETNTDTETTANTEAEETTTSETETTSEEEQSTETSSETTTDTETTTKNPPPDFDALLSEKSGGKFKTYQEIQDHFTRLSDNQKTEQDELDNDLIAKFNQFRTGRSGDSKATAKLFLETQLMEVDSLDAKDVIRAKMKLDNPNRSVEDINFLLENKYKLDEEEYEANEIRLSKLQMEDDATNARKELKEMQSKVALKEGKASISTKEQQEQIKTANEKWQKDVATAMTGFDKMELPLNDKGEEFNFGVDNQDEIKGIISNLPDFWNRYVSKDEQGNVVEHIDKLRSDVSLITNREQIFKALYEHGISKGREELIKERKNPSSKDHQENTDDNTTKSEMEELAEGLGAQLR